MGSTIKKAFKTLFDFFEIVIVCSAVFAVVYFFVGQLLKVTGDSMYPTYKNGEQIMAEKLSLRFEDLKRGETIVFRHPNDNTRLLIKRIIALPGDTIAINGGKVYINEDLLMEPYLNEQNKTFGGLVIQENNKYLIPQNEYILMGDNRDESSDSRDFNTVSKGNIIGRVFMVYYPFSNFRLTQQR